MSLKTLNFQREYNKTPAGNVYINNIYKTHTYKPITPIIPNNQNTPAKISRQPLIQYCPKLLL